MKYSFDSRIRYSEVGEDKKLSLASMIDYFQDCSTFQSEDLGVGLDFSTARNRAWFLCYWQIHFNRQPELAEEVKIGTIPYEIKGFFGKRNYWMEDAKGEMLAYADSLWVYLNTETGHPVSVDSYYADIYGKGERLPMESLSRKIMVPKECRKEEVFPVVQSHLDTNHHVNNAQYIKMAEAYLPEHVKVKRLRVEYRKAALLHDRIMPMVYEADDIITVSLCDEVETPFAVLEFQIEKE